MKFRNSRSEALIKPYHFYKDTKTQAQHAYDCDINNIVAGMASPMSIRNRVLSDEVKKFSPDMYTQALYTKAAAENAFNELPSNVRAEFGNNPAKMLEFISDPKNTERCIELGLMVRNESKEFAENIKQIVKNSATSKTAEAVTSEKSQGV